MAPNGQGCARPEVPPCPRQPPPCRPAHARPSVSSSHGLRRGEATPPTPNAVPLLHPTPSPRPSSQTPAAPTAYGHHRAVRWLVRPAWAPGPGRCGQASWKLQQRRRRRRQRQPWLFARKPMGRGGELRRHVPSRPRRGGGGTYHRERGQTMCGQIHWSGSCSEAAQARDGRTPPR